MADLVPVVIPSFEPVLTLVTDGVHSPHTKRAYRAALTEFLLWCRASERPTFSKAVVQAYRSSLDQRNLAASTIQVQLSAIRRLAAEMADNGLLDPQAALAIGKVRGPRRVGVRLGNWLALGQAEEMLALPDTKTIASSGEFVGDLTSLAGRVAEESEEFTAGGIKGPLLLL